MQLITKDNLRELKAFFVEIEFFENGVAGGYGAQSAALEVDDDDRLIGVWAEVTQWDNKRRELKSRGYVNLIESNNQFGLDLAAEFQRRFDNGAFEFDLEKAKEFLPAFSEYRTNARISLRDARRHYLQSVL